VLLVISLNLYLSKYVKKKLVLGTNVFKNSERFGPFAFGEALCVGPKTNVPNVRLAKIELK
jgi:hypothetical protein